MDYLAKLSDGTFDPDPASVLKHYLSASLLGLDRQTARKNFLDVVVEGLRMLPYYVQKRTPPPMTKAVTPEKPRKLMSIFQEQSTRTDKSFQEAARALGWEVGQTIDAGSSSLGKGESLTNTSRMLAQYGATHVVVRSKIEGIGVHLAENLFHTSKPDIWVPSDTSVIIGGSGTQSHLSQVTLDVCTLVAKALGVRTPNDTNRLPEMFWKNHYLIRKTSERVLDNLKIAFVGDLAHSRVVHEWIELGRWFDIEYRFISPAILRPRSDATEGLHRVSFSEDIMASCGADVLYAIRLQRERLDKHMPEHEVESTIYEFQVSEPVFHKIVTGSDTEIVLMDAQPIDATSPMVHPKLWHHPQNIMFMQSAFGPPARMSILRITDLGRHRQERVLHVPVYRQKESDVLSRETSEEHQKKFAEKHSGEELFAAHVNEGEVADRLEVGMNEIANVVNIRAGLYANRPPRLRGEDFNSKSLVSKDVLYLHGLRVPPWLRGVYSFISPGMRMSIMRSGGKNAGYRRIIPTLPQVVAEVFICPNQNCVTRVDPEAYTHFRIHVSEDGDLGAHCSYCNQHFSRRAMLIELAEEAGRVLVQKLRSIV